MNDSPTSLIETFYSSVSPYTGYAMSMTSIVSLTMLPGLLAVVISCLTIVKLTWDLWDKYQTKRQKRNA